MSGLVSEVGLKATCPPAWTLLRSGASLVSPDPASCPTPSFPRSSMTSRKSSDVEFSEPRMSSSVIHGTLGFAGNPRLRVSDINRASGKPTSSTAARSTAPAAGIGCGVWPKENLPGASLKNVCMVFEVEVRGIRRRKNPARCHANLDVKSCMRPRRLQCESPKRHTS